MKIIGLCGFATVGKSTITKAMIASHGVGEVASFAAELKADIDPLFSPGVPKEVKRPVYVAYGAAKRAIDPDYWIARLVSTLADDGVYIIDDVRYANEVKWIRSEGGVTIRIARPGIGPMNDEEYRSFRIIERDYPDMATIVNDSAVDAAAHLVYLASKGVLNA